jgi:hypothetical protein
VLDLISSDASGLSSTDYKHLFLDLIFKLQLPVQGSDHEGVNEACQICVNLLADVFIQYTQSLDPESPDDFKQFSLLWLGFMKVML